MPPVENHQEGAARYKTSQRLPQTRGCGRSLFTDTEMSELLGIWFTVDDGMDYALGVQRPHSDFIPMLVGDAYERSGELTKEILVPAHRIPLTLSKYDALSLHLPHRIENLTVFQSVILHNSENRGYGITERFRHEKSTLLETLEDLTSHEFVEAEVLLKGFDYFPPVGSHSVSPYAEAYGTRGR